MKPILSEYAKRQRWQAMMQFVSGDVLDIGCGWTVLPDHLNDRQSYVGIDKHRGVLDFYTKRYPHYAFYYRDLNAEPLNLQDRQFDTVVMAAVIEHLQSPERILHEIPSLLAPNGVLLITTPSPLGDMIHQIGSRLRLFWKETAVEHIKIFGRRDLFALVTGCGFEVVHFSHFLLGVNQLIVCRPAPAEKTGK